MRLVTFEFQGKPHIGAQISEGIVDFRRCCPDLPADMIAFISLGPSALDQARAALLAVSSDWVIPHSAVTLLAPIPHPDKILCIGHNYAGHIGIGRTELPEYPNFFCKTANTIIAHQQPIRLPRVTDQVDYEAELAVIIGRRAKDIPQNEAMDYVAGYSLFNDVSARDYQKRGSQWFLGKSFDTFGPLGPTLVTVDEVPDPHCLDLELRVNGVVKQRTNTCDLIFSVPRMVSYLSQVMTLEPGDVIATGTPAKLPEAANPQEFLKAGDVVEITIGQLGTLINPIWA